MKKIIVFFILFIIFILSFNKQDINNQINKKETINDNKQVTNNIKLSYKNEIIELPLEEYVIGVVACEMPATFNIEALKALSVAARTFALYKISKNKDYIMKSSTSDQCYISIDKMKSNWKTSFDKNYNIIKTATNETNGKYMTYNDKVIISFYFSISNGYTENSEDVFSQKLAYLRSTKSSWDSKYDYKEKSVKFTIKDFLNKLSIKDNKINKLNVSKNNINKVTKIKVNNKEFKGTKFRSLLKLRSTDINIKYDDAYVYITTKGNGHGVGLSQYGANAMAEEGYKYDEILKYYYNGIKIVNN